MRSSLLAPCLLGAALLLASQSRAHAFLPAQLSRSLKTAVKLAPGQRTTIIGQVSGTPGVNDRMTYESGYLFQRVATQVRVVEKSATGDRVLLTRTLTSDRVDTGRRERLFILPIEIRVECLSTGLIAVEGVDTGEAVAELALEFSHSPSASVPVYANQAGQMTVASADTDRLGARIAFERGNEYDEFQHAPYEVRLAPGTDIPADFTGVLTVFLRNKKTGDRVQLFTHRVADLQRRGKSYRSAFATPQKQNDFLPDYYTVEALVRDENGQIVAEAYQDLIVSGARGS